MKRRYIVGICGASGVIYGITLVNQLLRLPVDIHVILSADGKKVMRHELNYSGNLSECLQGKSGHAPHPTARLHEHDVADFFAAPASGSFRHNGMIVAPCTVKTLAAVATGIADNLLTRAADICLKERRPLILVPRETPFSAIHLENMLRLTQAGATILPAAPAFYFGPRSIQDLDNFLSHCHRKRYPNRSTIIYEGDSSDTLYYIVSGSVSVVLEDDDGKEVVVAYLNAGDFFGEMGLFETTGERSAWVRARSACENAAQSQGRSRFHWVSILLVSYSDSDSCRACQAWRRTSRVLL